MKWFRCVLLGFACLLPWVAVLAVFGWVLARQWPQDGRFALDIPLDGRSPWFEAFLPGQRATSPGVQPGGWTGQRITDEPAYARLRVPGAYDEAEIRMEFHPHDQPLIEIGVERGSGDQRSYELLPLWSRELARSGFERVQAGTAPWWAHPGVGLAELAGLDEARAFWHATGTVPEAWMDTGPALPRTVSSSLRGAHDFFFVPLDGRIDITFALQDMNRARAHSTAAFRLTRGQELLWTDAVSFGGRDDQKPSVVTEKPFHFQGLAPGVYRLSVLADDSIFVRAWTTTAKHWVIGPRVYFADEVGYSASSTPPVAVWTNSYHLEAKTLHKEGLQTLAFGTAQTALTSTHATVALTRAPAERRGPVLFRAPKGNVWTVGDGFVSWEKDALFFPVPRRLTDETSLAGEGIQAVATTYESPEPLEDGWYAATFRVRLDPAQDRLKLVLAAPGIKRRGAFVDVRRFRVMYRRPPRAEAWWPTLKREFMAAWRRW